MAIRTSCSPVHTFWSHQIGASFGAFGIAVVAATMLAMPAAAGGRGETTIAPQKRMGDPLVGLTSTQLQDFALGKTQYLHVLTLFEGLGPVFNKSSCGNCHSNPTGGPGGQIVKRFGRIDKGVFDPLEHLGGSLLQDQFIIDGCFEVIPPEANIVRNRVTNGALAYGLVEAIPDAAIAYNETYPPAPGISGKVHWVGAFEDPPMSPLRAGRFGWKAQVATVLTFSADASLNEMGLTNQFVTGENDPNGINPPSLRGPDNCDIVADPEDNYALGNGTNKRFINVITDFQRFLAEPPQTPKTGMTGETVFNNLGCNACHIPSFTTSNNPSLEDAIRNKTIRPYSDWLLHDMGAFGDGIVQGDADGPEMKTPPLWGVRRRNPMLHDGSAAGGTLEERVDASMAAHDQPLSEAEPSAEAYFLLSPLQKGQLIAFLNSLGRIEFDMDGDDDVDILDFPGFHGCFGPGPYNPDSPCAVSDINVDGDVDLDDFDSFMLAYFGPRRDCNSNGIIDLRDILTGVSTDVNDNAIPDSCEPTCDTDLNGTHGTDIDDLLLVITTWGPCTPSPAPCPADINLTEDVNIDDLLQVINSWGVCP